MEPETEQGERFLRQNPACKVGLTATDIDVVDTFAKHHAGGLYVMLRHLEQRGLYVKMHDTWGDPADDGEGPVIVHLYDADDGEREDLVLSFPNGHEAIHAFLTIK